ncbi:hypothetical protein [Streptomyces pinistramenti]|uniref:hypothetical protein n=1 Tax=Streptomyces pinistramenti TaxID=2884812 RepID=UPI001D07E526|nr:hypothetical protein [Streptomyces pinistramenti]MCB5908455.1 hypothetical protein [Streptomyces pinistramenti]
MAGRIRGLEDSVEIACRRLAQSGAEAPPEPIPDAPGAIRAAIAAVCRRIGGPAIYGGAVRGPYVRWTMEGRVLLLSRSAATTLHLAVWHPHDLAEAERGHFDTDPHSVDFARLPYMWQLQVNPPWPPPSRPAGTSASTHR